MNPSLRGIEMLSDAFIHDALERDRERQREERPRLQLPLHTPDTDRRADADEDDDEETSNRGVTIIDMSSGEEIDPSIG